jgi:rhodanese-related sulfurtransferase
MNVLGLDSTQVNSQTLNDWLCRQERVKLVDVRTPAEFESAHIPGSTNLPLDVLERHKEELSECLTEPVVLICRSGARADQARRALAGVGVLDAAVLEGGMLAWERVGGAVERGQPRWDLERQVRLVAGSLVLGAVAASTFVSPAKWVAGAVGAGLAIAAIRNDCPMGMLLSKLPYNQGAACNPTAALAELGRPPTEGGAEN